MGVLARIARPPCTVTGHDLKQPEAAPARSAPVIDIEPSLTELERHLRRTL